MRPFYHAERSRVDSLIGPSRTLKETHHEAASAQRRGIQRHNRLVSPEPAEAWDRGDVQNFATIPAFAPSGPGAACPNEVRPATPVNSTRPIVTMLAILLVAYGLLVGPLRVLRPA